MSEILSFSLDSETLKELEEVQKALGIKNRSELVRAGLRNLMAERRELEKLSGLTTAIAIAVHEEGGEENVAEIGHEFKDITATQIHHNAGRDCLELFILNGNAKRIVEFGKELKKSKRVKYSRVVSVR